MSKLNEIYSIEKDGLATYIIKRQTPSRYDDKKYESEWYNPKDDKWWNHKAIGSEFHDLETCKMIYEKLSGDAKHKIVMSTEIKDETISSMVLKILAKVLDRI